MYNPRRGHVGLLDSPSVCPAPEDIDIFEVERPRARAAPEHHDVIAYGDLTRGEQKSWLVWKLPPGLLNGEI